MKAAPVVFRRFQRPAQPHDYLIAGDYGGNEIPADTAPGPARSASDRAVG